MKRISNQLLPLIVLAAVICACKWPAFTTRSDEPTNVANASNSSVAEAPSSGAFAPSGDPVADVRNASNRFIQSKSFQAKMSTEGSTPMKLELQFVAPDRYRIKTGTMETVIIGKETYLNVNGRWMRSPVDMGSSIPSMRDAFTEEGLKGISSVEYTGDETVNGKESMVYKYNGKAVKGGSDYISRLWVARDDGLPQRVQVTYNGGPLKTAVINYEYNDIAIEKPAVK
ncbi:MAG: hypothetical protein ABI539_07810 [Acidobacteriota bacterium]